MQDHTTHNWGNPVVIKNPTCTEKGSQTVTCSECGAVETEVIPPTGHTYSTEWSKDEEYHWHVSSCVHEGLKGSFEPHTWDNSVITKASTCTEEGI